MRASDARASFGLVCALTLCAATAPTPVLADHRDGPLFENVADNGRADLGELYVFRSPANANNTVFILTVSPFADFVTPRTFDTGLIYEIKIDTTGDGIEDITFEATFTGTANDQNVVLRGLPLANWPPTGTLASGLARRNLAVAGGGTFRAGLHDDPFFFDHFAWDQRVDDGVGTFPRALGVATNFYGPAAKILALTLEIPSNRIGPVNSLIGAWGRVVRAGVQQDRVARPFINLGLIPPMPRNSVTFGDQRTSFNQGTPNNDRTNFSAFMVVVYQTFWARTLADSNALTNLLLPDLLISQVGNPNGFGTFVASGTGQTGFFAGTVLGNGRRLRDDVMDIMLNLNSNGAITTDNVPDDNGTRIRDGNMGTVAAFPYIGSDDVFVDGFE